MKQMLLVFLLAMGSSWACQAVPIVRIQLQVEPSTRSFTCSYTFILAATDTATALIFNLNKEFELQPPRGSTAGQRRVSRVFYPYFADTLHRIELRCAARSKKPRQLAVTYTGKLGPDSSPEQVMAFSGHSNWLPFRPYREYELVDYELEVTVPTGYNVLSTTPALRQRRAHWKFRGSTSNIEITALVAKQFQHLKTVGSSLITVSKVGVLARQDTSLLQKAESIIAFYNRTIGTQDPISRFTIFLPGTNRNAFSLLDNAAVITYSDFDVGKQGDLLVLAHEISHKWWGYGSVHNEDEWLNEAFATYSSLLYLQSVGDTKGATQVLAKLTQTAANTPAIIGFDRRKYELAMFRRVIYNKGAAVLAALHARVGKDLFLELLATAAGRKVSTTAAFLDVVEQTAGKDTRLWLLGELSR